MPVSDEVLDRARKLSRPAVEAVLADSYPAVCRLSRALAGREGAARQIMAGVMKRSVRVLPTWRSGSSPENWFYHHTILAARRSAGSPPTPREDLLSIAAGADAPGDYVAFVLAIRKLVPQQREAFILHYGERLNERLLGVAMDCSAGAASAHLNAAKEAIGAVAGQRGTALTALFARAYARLSPTQEAVIPLVRRPIRAALWRRRLRRLVRRVIVLAILTALAYAGWHWRAQLAGWVARARHAEGK
ncbi:MAG TPA: hypothetical protein VFC78_06450 [Tepidisphaeraceae bacterium]|nr:hypothetical protein [Tepidisphaeraceae bacterium]